MRSYEAGEGKGARTRATGGGYRPAELPNEARGRSPRRIRDTNHGQLAVTANASRFFHVTSPYDTVATVVLSVAHRAEYVTFFAT